MTNLKYLQEWLLDKSSLIKTDKTIIYFSCTPNNFPPEVPIPQLVKAIKTCYTGCQLFSKSILFPDIETFSFLIGIDCVSVVNCIRW